MPFYQVFHTCPLATDQRQSIATAITNLHCTAFKTPSFFVHVSFVKQQAAPVDDTYFVAGKPHSNNSNRVVGVVRTSPSRTKADWDELAAKIEDAWNEAVGACKGKETSDGASFDEEKRLSAVMFTPIIAVREGGMAIPEAGHEDAWLKQQLPYFKEMSQSRGLQSFADLVEEVEQKGRLAGHLG